MAQGNTYISKYRIAGSYELSTTPNLTIEATHDEDNKSIPNNHVSRYITIID